MASIQYRKGDATDPVGDGNKIIAHVVNDQGGWGKGFVLALSGKWPDVAEAYHSWYEGREDFFLGEIKLVGAGPGLWVAHLLAQHGYRSRRNPVPLRYAALRACLDKLAGEAKEFAASVHVPRLGCGLAGGEWARVGPILEETLGVADVAVTVYDLD